MFSAGMMSFLAFEKLFQFYHHCKAELSKHHYHHHHVYHQSSSSTLPSSTTDDHSEDEDDEEESLTDKVNTLGLLHLLPLLLL